LYKKLMGAATALVVATGIVHAHEEQVSLDRVVFVTSPKWYVLKNKAVPKNILYFRKYALAVIDGRLAPIDKVKNIANFACQRNSQLRDHVVVYVPRWADLKTIDERSWTSEMELRVLIDDTTFKTVGEYRDKEFFIDITDVNRESMMELLTSSEIVIEFGPAQERIGIRQASRTPDGTGNIEGFLDQLVPDISKAIGGGAVQSFSTDSMLRTCAGFKKTGRFWSERR
jgi:hypothetical protein